MNDQLTPRMSRRNGILFLLSNSLIYLTAPVSYVGVIQAALCDKLNASSTVANLPASAYLLGFLAPFFVSWVIPSRLERSAVVVGCLVNASTQALVAVVLFFVDNDSIRIGSVVLQALIYGVSGSSVHVLIIQCLNRGTTLEGRARALKLTFTIGPIAAAASSLAAQWVLRHGFAYFQFPRDFGLLYLCAAPLTGLIALLSHRYQLVEIESQPKPALLRYMKESVRSFAGRRELRLAWIAYFLYYSVVFAAPNISLYTREALGREPKDFSGVIMALRFGMKAMAGFALGALALWKGVRAPLITCLALLGGAVLWAWVVPGYPYLLAFGFIGAGELAGIYFPNYVISICPLGAGTRNMALMELAAPVAGFGPALHGFLTDRFGFKGSFLLALAAASLSLILILRLPQVKVRRDATRPSRGQDQGELIRSDTAREIE